MSSILRLRLKVWAGSCALSLVLSACAHRSVQECQPLTLSQIAAHWAVGGRIAVIGQNPRSSFQGYFEFDHVAQQAFHLRLSGPLGVGGATIDQDTQGVRLTRSGKPTVYAHDLQRLMKSQLGWSVPVHQLSRWLFGQPVDGLRRTMSCFNGQQLPSKIRLQTPSGLVKLSLKHWSFSGGG